MRTASLKETWLPLVFTALALIGLNWGLYGRLARQAPPSLLEFPYQSDFSAEVLAGYRAFGGDWAQRDGTLVQLSPTGDDLGIFIPLAIPADQAYQHEARVRWLGGTMGGGLLFNAQQTQTRQQSHMTRFFVNDGQMTLLYGYYGDNSDFVGQGGVAVPVAVNDEAWHTLAVQVVGERYQLLVDGRVVASDIPLLYQGGAVGFMSSTSQVAFDDVAVTAWSGAIASVLATPPAFTPAAATLGAVLAGDSFDDAAAGEAVWRPFSGIWRFAGGSYRQEQTEGFDLGTLYTPRSFEGYRLRATIRHEQGAGGGLLFAAPEATSKNGAAMLRYVDERFLTWGVFDAQGAYQGLGSAEVGAPGTAPQTLEVEHRGATFGVWLNGTLIAEGIPAPRSAGYIGLVAAQSIVAFDDVEIRALGGAEATPEATQAAAELTLSNISGTWATQDGITTQSDTGEQDYIAGVGASAEIFTLSSDIGLPSDPADAGGGLVFHMGGRDDVAGGHMVRLSRGGNEVFWGRYDATRAFIGLGSAPLSLDDPTNITLAVQVAATSYAIVVNGQTIAADIPLESSGGWIGLVSYRGPVSFRNINLRVEGI